MTALEDLRYGNIRPVENYLDGNTEYRSLLRLVSKNRVTLESELSKNQIELLEKYSFSVNEMNSAFEFAAFKYGFTCAMKLFCEIIK